MFPCPSLVLGWPTLQSCFMTFGQMPRPAAVKGHYSQSQRNPPSSSTNLRRENERFNSSRSAIPTTTPVNFNCRGALTFPSRNSIFRAHPERCGLYINLSTIPSQEAHLTSGVPRTARGRRHQSSRTITEVHLPPQQRSGTRANSPYSCCSRKRRG